MKLSTHVLDTSRGAPGAGIALRAFRVDGDAWQLVAEATTNDDGRTDAPLVDPLSPGLYEIVFDVASYYRALDVATFYDVIAIRFVVTDDGRNYHVPLLVSPWGYSTYRGS